MAETARSGVRQRRVGVAVAAFVVALVATAQTVGAIDYYVDPAGNDAGPGTSALPWRTIQRAADTMSAGDTAYVRAGTYAESVTLTRSGAAGAPVRFVAAAGATPVLDGSGGLYAGFTTDSNLDVSDIVIDGFSIRNYAGFGIVAWSTNDRWTLLNLLIQDNDDEGIRLSNSAGSHVETVRLEGNAGGFDCTPILPGLPDDPGCTDLTIVEVQAIDNGTGSHTGVDAFAVERGDRIDVERCLAAGGPGDGFDFKSQRTMLSRVIAYGTRNNIKLWGGGSGIENALAYDATADANLVLAGGGSYTIANSTIANMTGYAYLATAGDGNVPTTVALHNTIFANDNPAMGGTLVFFDSGVSLTADNNLYYNPYRSDALVCAAFPPYGGDCFSAADIEGQTTHPWMEPNARSADPSFVSAGTKDFHLAAGSPAIDAGTAGFAPAVDLDGKSRSQGSAPDIGAYEYGSAAPNPTPTPASYSIAGAIRYYASGEPVDGVTVRLLGATPVAVDTDTNGAFVHTASGGGNRQIEPARSGGADSGVSALDAAYALQATVGLRTFTAAQSLACDVSGNGTVSAYDASLILQYRVGLIAAFPVAAACGGDWIFVPSAAVAQNQRIVQPQVAAGTCQAGGIAYEPLIADAAAQDFLAIAFGDCTGNWP